MQAVKMPLSASAALALGWLRQKGEGGWKRRQLLAVYICTFISAYIHA